MKRYIPLTAITALVIFAYAYCVQDSYSDGVSIVELEDGLVMIVLETEIGLDEIELIIREAFNKN
jgi:hypothetical protein